MSLAIAAAVVSIVFFVCMGWAVRGHFRGEGRVAFGMHVATFANAVAMLWFLWQRWRVITGADALPIWREAAGIALTLLALGLFWWAIATTRRTRLTLAFSKDDPSFLLETGPYALVRHPFYTSYVAFWVAAACETPGLGFWVVPLAMAILYLRAATLEERKFSRSQLSSGYRAYRARTGMMLPRPWVRSDEARH